jgi:hypothetical protein
MTKNGYEPNSSQDDTKLKIYTILVEMADRVSQRRQTANNYFLSINTAILGSITYFSHLDESWFVLLSAFTGTVICILWSRSVESHKALNAAKFEIIGKIEQDLPIQPFSDEWKILKSSTSNRKYRSFHEIEIWIPRVFFFLYLVSATSKIHFIMDALSRAAANLGY